MTTEDAVEKIMHACAEHAYVSAECAVDHEHPCLVVWSATAKEHLGALVNEYAMQQLALMSQQVRAADERARAAQAQYEQSCKAAAAYQDKVGRLCQAVDHLRERRLFTPGKEFADAWSRIRECYAAVWYCEYCGTVGCDGSCRGDHDA